MLWNLNFNQSIISTVDKLSKYSGIYVYNKEIRCDLLLYLLFVMHAAIACLILNPNQLIISSQIGNAFTFGYCLFLHIPHAFCCSHVVYNHLFPHGLPKNRICKTNGMRTHRQFLSKVFDGVNAGQVFEYSFVNFCTLRDFFCTCELSDSNLFRLWHFYR